LLLVSGEEVIDSLFPHFSLAGLHMLVHVVILSTNQLEVVFLSASGIHRSVGASADAHAADSFQVASSLLLLLTRPIWTVIPASISCSRVLPVEIRSLNPRSGVVVGESQRFSL